MTNTNTKAVVKRASLGANTRYVGAASAKFITAGTGLLVGCTSRAANSASAAFRAMEGTEGTFLNENKRRSLWAIFQNYSSKGYDYVDQ